MRPILILEILTHTSFVAPELQNQAMKPERLLARIKDNRFSNVRAGDMKRLLTALGFELERTRVATTFISTPGCRRDLTFSP